VTSDPASPIHAVAFAPDGRMLASAHQRNVIRIWNPQSGQLIRTLEDHTAAVRSIAFSPNGRQLASAGDDKTIRLWDVATGRILRVIPASSAPVYSIAFSPDGRHVASGADGSRDSVKLWSVETGEAVRTIEASYSSSRSIALSRDGRLLATTVWSRKAVRLWDIDSGRMIKQFIGHKDAVQSLAFSADGRRLASAGEKSILVWQTDGELETAVAAIPSAHPDSLAAARTMRSSTWEPDALFFGMSGSTAAHLEFETTSSAAACRNACLAKEACLSWTFSLPQSGCSLHSTAGKASVQNNKGIYTSGRIVQPSSGASGTASAPKRAPGAPR
jgi:WD40 repeat protein